MRPLLWIAVGLAGCEAKDDGDTRGGGPGDSAPADDSGNTGPIDERVPTTYVIERYAGDLFAISRDTGSLIWTFSGLAPAVGLAVDRRGDIYLGCTDTDLVGSLVRVRADGSASEVVIPADGTLLRPQGLWYDAASDTLLLADVNASMVYEVALDSFALTTLTDQVPEPSDVTRRPGEQTLYVTARGEGRVYAVASDGTATVLAEGLPDAHSLAPGQDGLLYVMVTGQRAVVSVDEATGESAQIVADFTEHGPVGLCLDERADGLMLTDHGGGTLFHLDLNTGTTTPFFSSEDDLYECGHNAPVDGDGDGWYAVSAGGPDCDDADAEVFPGRGC